MHVLDLQPVDAFCAGHGVQARAEAQLDVARRGGLATELRDAAQLIFEVDDRHLPRELREVQRLLDRAVRAAHDVHVFAGVRLAVARGVHAHALSGQLRLAGDAEPARCAAVREDDARRLIRVLFGAHRLDFARQLHTRDGLVHDLHAGVQRLLLHARGERSARLARLKRRVVRHGRHSADQSAHLRFLQNQRLFSAAHGVNARADARGAGSDDDDVVHA